MDRRKVFESLDKIFKDVFDDETIIISEDTTAADVAGWDSLSNIQLLVSVESFFSIRFSAAQVASLEKLGDLATLIEQKLERRLFNS